MNEGIMMDYDAKEQSAMIAQCIREQAYKDATGREFNEFREDDRKVVKDRGSWQKELSNNPIYWGYF